MNIEALYQEKSLKCVAFTGAVAAHNFNGEDSFMVLSDRKNVGIDEGTCFQAASLSKLVAALTTALYFEDNNLEWHAGLNGQLPIAVDNRTTLAHLFAHCAGINVSGFPGYESEPLPRLDDIINGTSPANTEAIRYVLPFGQYSYSGGGYCLAQFYLEKISGMKFADLADKYLFNPLKLKNTSFHLRFKDVRAAVGYDENREIVGKGWHLYPEAMAAGLWTTPSDYLRILTELIKAVYGESQIISPAVAEKILQPVVTYIEDGREYQYAQGIKIYKNVYSHSGCNKGYKSLFALDKTLRKAFVIMSNDDRAGKVLDL